MAVDWIRAHPELRVSLFANFAPIDSTSVTYACGSGTNAGYFMAHVGVVEPDGVTLKPWGVAYRGIVQDASANPILGWPSPSVDAGSLAFGSQIVNSPSELQNVTLTNTGWPPCPSPA